MISKLIFSFFIVLVLAKSSFGQCIEQRAWPDSDFQKLMTTLNGLTDGDKLSYLQKNLKDASKGFNSTQTLKISDSFTFPSSKSQFFTDNARFILGLACKDVVHVMNSATFASTALEILPCVVNITTDLEQNNESIVAWFTFNSDKEAATQIIASTTYYSCIWGDISSAKVIFVVDASSSMDTTFTSSIDHNTYSRFDFVTYSLAETLLSLPSNFEFNIIVFDDSPTSWQPSIVPATSKNVDTAIDWLYSNSPAGSTNMLAAMELAFKDANAMGIYLLSDGEPNCCSNQIISESSAWSNQKTGRQVNTISFQAGGTFDPYAADFMVDIAASAHGVAKAVI